ncbi:MAG: YitT family protein [Oscillospiraceae bacterium]
MKWKTTLTTGIRQYCKQELWIELAAAALFSLGIEVFSAPNRIVGGGVSGIATILNTLFGLPIGGVSLLLNLPLLAIGWKRIGRAFLLRTLRVVTMITVMMDVVVAPIPPYRGSALLAAVFGGVLTGAGLGMILMRGGSTGGTDIIVKLIKLRHPHLSFGRIVLLTDLAVVAAAALLYRSLETVMYGVILIYAASEVIDRLIAGADARRLVLVVTRKRESVSDCIVRTMGRGTTLLEAIGGYSGLPTGVLMCVIEDTQLFALKRAVRALDPEAFVIVAQAAETLGRGFKSIHDE